MSFLFPTFLMALAAVAVPVLIHLFNFRKFKRLQFTNVRFLQEIRQETDSRSKIKHWLILAARVLTLVFLVLAFARPYIPLGENIAAGGEGMVSIYVDNSYSMEGPGNTGTLLDQALLKARQIAAGYPLNTRFQLITNDFKGEHRRWVGREAFYDLLDEVEITPASRTLDQIMLRMEDAFEGEPEEIRQGYLISDFQKSFLPDPGRPVQDTTLRLSLVMVEGAPMANLAIDSVWFISPAHQAGNLEKLVVKVQNYSDEPVEDVPLKLVINGQQEAIGNVSVLARASMHDTLVFRSGGPGWKLGELSIPDHPITFDDRFFFSYRVAPEVKVLLIKGDAAGFHIETLFADDELVDLRVNGEHQVNYSLIPENDLVILNGLSAVSSGLADRLKEFVEQGGHLAVFPPLAEGTADAGTDPLPGYNAFLQQLQTDTFEGVSGQPNQVISLNLDQSVFRDVFERIPENPDLPSVQRYFRLSRASQTRREPLMTMRGNDELMARYSTGKGAVYLSAVSLDESLSNLPRHGLFVPLLYRMALLSIPNYPLYYTVGTDQSVTTGALDPSTQGGLRIRKEGFEIIPSIRSGGGGSELFVSDQIREPGNYILTGREGAQLAVFAFNPAKTESDLSYFAAEDLKEIGHSVKVIDPRTASLDRVVSVENLGIQLWKYCVVLALVFLAAEIMLIRMWPASPKIGSI